MGRYVKLSNDEEFDSRGEPRIPLYEDKSEDSRELKWVDSIENDFVLAVLRNHNAKVRVIWPLLKSWGFSLAKKMPLYLPTREDFWSHDHDLHVERGGIIYRLKVIVKTSFFTGIEDAQFADIVVTNPNMWAKQREKGTVPDGIVLVSAFTLRPILAPCCFSHLWMRREGTIGSGGSSRSIEQIRAAKAHLRSMAWFNATAKDDAAFVTETEYLKMNKENRERHAFFA